MKKLNKSEIIAVFAGIGLIGYLMFGGVFVSLFQNPGTRANKDTQMTEIESGVRSEDVKLGEGAIAAPGDLITVHYVGRLTNGRVFDSSVDRDQPFTFTLGLGEVIRGWDEGLVGMRVGGARRITIAPDFAYGDQGVGTIPPNSTLVFDVELIDVQRAQ